MTAKLGSGLDFIEVGQSAYRALCHAMATPPAWDNVAMEHQDAFHGLGRNASALLQKYEGAPWAEVAKEVYALFHAHLCEPFVAFSQLTPLGRLAWEAVARHLTCLYAAEDAEDLGDLADLESSWRLWCFQRCHTPGGGFNAGDVDDHAEN